jgi:ketosteroid isomerase-like protein
VRQAYDHRNSVKGGVVMGEARELMNRITKGVMSADREALQAVYAPDAVIEAPDAGSIRGQDAILEWLLQFGEAFPDASWESLHEHEAGDTAIDEGFFVGTHTGPLAAPTGETIEATGNRVRLRACDAATVAGGRVTSHRFYFDQMDFLAQLGLLPNEQTAEQPTA